MKQNRASPPFIDASVAEATVHIFSQRANGYVGVIKSGGAVQVFEQVGGVHLLGFAGQPEDAARTQLEDGAEGLKPIKELRRLGGEWQPAVHPARGPSLSPYIQLPTEPQMVVRLKSEVEVPEAVIDEQIERQAEDKEVVEYP